jgi:hypothetical protein
MARVKHRRSQHGRRSIVRGPTSAFKAKLGVIGFSPASVPYGSGAVNPLTITGFGFTPSSIVWFDGAPVPTTYLNVTTLTIVVSAGTVSVPGFYPLYVEDASYPATSTTVVWAVTFPVPTYTITAPSSAFLGSGATTTTATGTNFFAAGTTAAIDGTNTPFAYVGATSGIVTIPASITNVAGDHAITITNAAPGGGTTAPRTYQTRYRTPAITSLDVTGIPTGGGDYALGVNDTSGRFYDPAAWPSGGTVGTVDGVAVPTAFVSATRVVLTIPASVTIVSGSKTIRVENPTLGGGGGASAGTPFLVGFLAPTVTSVAPVATPLVPSITYTDGPTVVAVKGTNFYAGGNTTVLVNGTPATTTYVSTTEVRFTYTPSTVQDLAISVTNNTGGGGGGTSGTVTLAISPLVTTITPNTGFQYDAGGIPAVVGGGPFLAGSVVSMNGSEVPTVWADASTLNITLPGTVSTATGSVIVRVRNATGRPDSAQNTVYAITIVNPLTDLTQPYSGSWDADHVLFTPSTPPDIYQADDIVNGTNPFKNPNTGDLNPTCQPDATLNNFASVVMDGVTEFLGQSFASNPLVSQMFPPADWVVFAVFKANSAPNNNTTGATAYNNAHVLSSDTNPGSRCGLAIVNNAGQMGVLFWMYDGVSFKATGVSTHCSFGSWCYALVKKSGTTLTISVNGEPFLTATTGVGNMVATTQRCLLGTAPPGAGNWKLNGAWRTLIIWPGSAVDIMRCQNYAHYQLGIV